MSGQLKARRRRRGGRGRGRRRGALKPVENQAGTEPEGSATGVEEESPRAPAETAGGLLVSDIESVEAPPSQPVPPKEAAAGEDNGDRSGDSGAQAAEDEGEWSPTLPGETRAPRRKKAEAPPRRARTGRTRRGGRGRGKTAEPAGKEAGAAGAKAEAADPAPQPAKPRRGRQSAARRSDARRTLVVNRTGEETRVAILEQGQLTEVFIERESSRGVIGNIYKGRVSKVLPGMQSAFVKIGLERDAFLYVSDISPGYDAYEGLLDLDEVEGGEEIREAAPKAGREDKIEKLLKEGQELLVQVTKEPIGTKGARITSYVTMPGRFLVLMPQVDHVGVSRKIGDARERGRLRKVVEKVRPKGVGFIVRTVAEGCDAGELEADATWLLSQWDEIREKAEKTVAPKEVRPELSLVPRMVRDLLTSNVSKVVIDDPVAHREALDLVKRLQPGLVDRVTRYDERPPIFEKFGIQAELDKALRSRVWLKSGGSIVINQTEALVAIDVNTGKFVGKRNLEDTVLKTNLEAATEIVRQLRLRDLGGIIVVDFIDMEERKSKRKLIEAFEKELQKDRARTKVLQISDFGLVEITRQRTKKSLERILCRTCPYCSGAGRIKTDTTVAIEIRRELEKLAHGLDGGRLVIRANPDVAHHLEAGRRKLLEGIRSFDRLDLTIRADSTLHHEQYEIVSL